MIDIAIKRLALVAFLEKIGQLASLRSTRSCASPFGRVLPRRHVRLLVHEADNNDGGIVAQKVMLHVVAVRDEAIHSGERPYAFLSSLVADLRELGEDFVGRLQGQPQLWQDRKNSNFTLFATSLVVVFRQPRRSGSMERTFLCNNTRWSKSASTKSIVEHTDPIIKLFVKESGRSSQDFQRYTADVAPSRAACQLFERPTTIRLKPQSDSIDNHR